MKKYSTKFSFATTITAKDIASQRKSLSSANVKNLKPLAEIKLASYEKLLPIAFDLAVVNMFNRNGDGIGTAEAKKIASMLQYQPINTEHYRRDICGVAVNSGFYSRPDHNPLDSENLPESDPYYLSVGGILYKLIQNGLAEFIKWENEDDSMTISASWEIAFDEYKIMRGSNLLAKCTEVKAEDESQYAKFLLCNGGTGFDDDGVPVFRRLVGDIEPIGIGITMTPAADVKGIVVLSEEELEELHEEKEDEDEDEEENSAKNKNKISQTEELDVIASREQHDMKPEDFKKLLQEALASKQDATTVDTIALASEMAIKQIDSALTKANDEWVAKQNREEQLRKDVEASKAAVEEKLQKASEKMAEMEKQLSEVNETLAKEQKAKADAERASKLDSIMNSFDEKFELTKEERSFALAELSASDLSDDAVKKISDKYMVLFASKAKKTGEVEKTPEQELSQASATGGTVSSVEGASSKLSDRIKQLKLEIEVI